MERPSPVPFFAPFVVKKGSKIRGKCSTGMPTPLSATESSIRSLGKAPHVLTYGMEGLQGIRVGTADALEIRIGYYGNLVCNAPGWNCVVQLSQ
mgnify:CR=1 FL=1